MPQKALIGTFIGGLKPEIADGMRLFRPKSLKEVISLARIKDKQLGHHKSVAVRAPIQTWTCSNVVAKATPSSTIRRLSWEETQQRRA